MSKEPPPKRHDFGGGWTDEKLWILHDYLTSYTTALRHQRRFTKGYIDAFAGTGYRHDYTVEAGPLFPDL